MSAQSLEDMARDALEAGTEAAALRTLLPAAQAAQDARLWQWAGLLQRARDEHRQALDSFAQAARLAPADPGIARGLAQIALEAGLDARALFERARALAPADGSVHLGLAAARFAAGEGELAARELEQLLIRSPLWEDGHAQLAQLYSMLGQAERAGSSIEAALSHAPGDARLWRMLWDLNVRAEDYHALQRNLDRAQKAGVSADASLYAAIANAELGETAAADALFAQVAGEALEALRVWQIRHLIRSGRADAALPLIDLGLRGPQAADLWPYASIVWRLTGDPRSDWLHGTASLIQLIDLSDDLPPLETLAGELRQLHWTAGEYLDQSVRGGSQTDGPLFSRIDSNIRALRSGICEAVQRYVAALPPPNPGHPLLGRRRDSPVRFSGSWSVRLKGGGRHASHVHPRGWISSALYVALPELQPSEPAQSGWLTIGQPPDNLQTGLSPIDVVQPCPGRLVLFPSWMWHGTLPFAAGERLTVAFDVRLPADAR